MTTIIILWSLFFNMADAKTQNTVTLNSDKIDVMGRVVWRGSDAIFSYPGVTFEFQTTAKRAAFSAQAIEGKPRLDVYLNGKLHKKWVLGAQRKNFEILSRNTDTPITVKIVNRGETWQGVAKLHALQIDDGEVLAPVKKKKHKLMVIGDSVSCGAVVDRAPVCEKAPHLSDAYQSYGMQLARLVDAEVHLVCYGGRGMVRSWDANPDDMQAPAFFDHAVPSASSPMLWDHTRFSPDVVLVSLGTNDFNLGVPDRQYFVEAYESFVKRLLAIHPNSQVLLTEGAMLNDLNPQRANKTIAQQYLGTVIENVNHPQVSYLPSHYHPGDDCDPHPTKAQHHKMAEELAPYVKQYLSTKED